MSQVTVTEKGKRLIATKFGIPYGLLLAYIERYGHFIVFIAGLVFGVLVWFIPLLAVGELLTTILLVSWADRHFDV